MRGRVKCGICVRKVEGAARRGDTIYYRCNARTLVPGSATALAHPAQIYLREDVITPAINRWIGTLFDPLSRDATINTLLEADDTTDRHLEQMGQLRDRVAAAEVALDRLRRALDAGWDPVELPEQYNAAAAEKRVAEAVLEVAPPGAGLSRQELESCIDRLSDMAQALDRAEADELSQLNSSLRLSLRYHHAEQILNVEVDPLVDRVGKLRVRGGT